jgi:hypothetical protein
MLMEERLVRGNEGFASSVIRQDLLTDPPPSSILFLCHPLKIRSYGSFHVLTVQLDIDNNIMASEKEVSLGIHRY